MSEATQYTLFSNRDLFNLIGPLIMERALFLTVGVADGMMVAYLGEASVSAVSMVNLLNIFLHNIFLAISVGGVVTASQCLGAKDSQAVHVLSSLAAPHCQAHRESQRRMLHARRRLIQQHHTDL